MDAHNSERGDSRWIVQGNGRRLDGSRLIELSRRGLGCAPPRDSFFPPPVTDCAMDRHDP
jgi:hypothetical protein